MEIEVGEVLRPGDKIRVQWGTLGQVEAKIARINSKGEVFARRYRPNMRNYTQERKVFVIAEDGRGRLFDLKPPLAKEVMM